MLKMYTAFFMFLILSSHVYGATFYFSDFETDNGGLTGTRDWEWGVYAFGTGSNCYSTTYTPPTGAHSGRSMWGTILNNCYNNLGNADPWPGCDNTNLTDDSILSLTVDLKSATPPVTLSFWNWHDGATSYDFGEVYVNSTEVFEHCPTGNGPDFWQLETIDISSYAGRTATIEFHFICSDVQAWSGWYIDDLKVEDTGSTFTPTSTGVTATPTSTATPPGPTATSTRTGTPMPTATATLTATPLPIPFSDVSGTLILILFLTALTCYPFLRYLKE